MANLLCDIETDTVAAGLLRWIINFWVHPRVVMLTMLEETVNWYEFTKGLYL